MDYAAFAESTTAAFLYTSLQFVALVVIGTIVLSLVSIWAIESLETVVREFKAWLHRSKRNGGMA